MDTRGTVLNFASVLHTMTDEQMFLAEILSPILGRTVKAKVENKSEIKFRGPD